MRWLLVLILGLLIGCAGSPIRSKTRKRVKTPKHRSKAQSLPSSRTPRFEHYARAESKRKAETAWSKILLRNERVFWPREVKESIQLDLEAPESKNIMFEPGHNFLFVVSSEFGREADLEIRVVNRDTGELLTEPGYRSHLYGIKGHALLGIPIWRGGMVLAGTRLPITVQIYLISGDRPLKIGVALAGAKFSSELMPVTEFEQGEEEW